MTLLLLALAPFPYAHATQVIEGNAVRIAYNSGGTWNTSTSGTGFEAWLGDVGSEDWVDFSYPGTPFQAVTVSYTAGGSSSTAYATSSTTSTFTTSGETDLSRGGIAGSAYTWTYGSVSIVKQETWEIDGSVVRVALTVTNTGSSTLTNLKLAYAVDPDQEAGTTYDTENDVLDLDADGTSDWVQSAGPTTGATLGFGSCGEGTVSLGHYSGWSTSGASVLNTTTLTDYAAAVADHAMVLRWTAPASFLPGASQTMVLLVSVGNDESTAQDGFLVARDLACSTTCDNDGDGVSATLCGGDDCDDTDPLVAPDALETWYDGIDQDCDGASDYDQDMDGVDAALHGGTDCDDSVSTTYPGAPDTFYDGVDADCDGASDYDQDGDGHDNAGFGGDDCQDADATVYPGATERYYDGIDSNCDTSDEYDADGDGHASAGFGGDDCNEASADIYPGAPETYYDGEDSNCDPSDEYDADGDGHDAVDHGGDDCDDSESSAFPGGTEVVHDGIDQDCDGLSDDTDVDGDGVNWPDDCDDADPSVSQGCEDSGDTAGGTDTAGDSSGDDGSSDRSDADVKTAGGCTTAPAGSTSWSVLAALGLAASVLRRRKA